MSEAEFPSEFLSVMARMGARPDLVDATKGHINVNENLTSHGIIRVAPLMLLADTVVGMRLESLVEDLVARSLVPCKTALADSDLSIDEIDEVALIENYEFIKLLDVLYTKINLI